MTSFCDIIHTVNRCSISYTTLIHNLSDVRWFRLMFSLDTRVCCAKTNEPIEMPFRGRLVWAKEPGGTLATPDEYDWEVCARRRCGLMSNYLFTCIFLELLRLSYILSCVVKGGNDGPESANATGVSFVFFYNCAFVTQPTAQCWTTIVEAVLQTTLNLFNSYNPFGNRLCIYTTSCIVTGWQKPLLGSMYGCYVLSIFAIK